MKNKLLPGLLLLTFNVLARDPFFPPDAACQPAVDAGLTWRLLGVIGHEEHYNGWLISPLGKSLRRQPGDPLPGTAWQIERIEAQAIMLTTTKDCQPPRWLTLKGQDNAQNDLSVADAD